jgi:flavin reductase (DIM6/NTAB) family NADH-FMN oxidoreductase RutF
VSATVHEAPPIPARAFRDSVGEFATGVTVVTAEHPEAGPAGMTLNAFTSVSLEPLLVLVSLGHGSRTLEAVRAGGRLAISVLHRGQRDVAIAFATPGGEFPAGRVMRSHDGFLVVRGAAATLHCSAAEIRRAGDHDLVLGAVVGMSHHGGEPMVFHRGRFGGLTTDAFVPPGHPISLDEGAGW